jgi:hypothetical protein
MFIRIDLKEHRQEVAGILISNGYKVSPAQKKMKSKKTDRNYYGLEIEKIDGDYQESEDDE